MSEAVDLFMDGRLTARAAKLAMNGMSGVPGDYQRGLRALDVANGKHLTREQVLRWRSNWGASDIRLIEEHLDRLGCTVFSVRGRNAYIRCSNDIGENGFDLHPGYIEFRKVTMPEGAEKPWITLSTFKPHEVGPQVPEISSHCAIHGLPIRPATGMCDTCEEYQ